MERALFCVNCMVDNGCTHKMYNTYVCAYTGAQAKLITKQHWQAQDSETVAHIGDVYVVDLNDTYVVCNVEAN